MLILLNKYSNNGKGFQKWEKYRPELEKKYIKNNYILISDLEEFHKSLRQEYGRGERLLVSAGGDGTINFLLNQIMNMKKVERRKVIMGAIGLGSSNDFHKSSSENNNNNGKVPLKLDYKNAVQHNVGQVDFEDENGKWQRRYFIINCSIGVIAQANFLFNSKEKIIKLMKSKWVEGTIWYSALKTLFSAKNIPTEIKVGDKRYSTDVSSLSVVINPHISGNLCYDFNISPQSDFFGVALCEKMGVLARLRTIFSLARSKFSGLPKTRSWKTDRIDIYPVSLTLLELDGEVCLARDIKIKLLQGILKVSQ